MFIFLLYIIRILSPTQKSVILRTGVKNGGKKKRDLAYNNKSIVFLFQNKNNNNLQIRF